MLTAFLQYVPFPLLLSASSARSLLALTSPTRSFTPLASTSISTFILLFTMLTPSSLTMSRPSSFVMPAGRCRLLPASSIFPTLLVSPFTASPFPLVTSIFGRESPKALLQAHCRSTTKCSLLKPPLHFLVSVLHKSPQFVCSCR
jgi:hypothetical protein